MNPSLFANTEDAPAYRAAPAARKAPTRARTAAAAPTDAILQTLAYLEQHHPDHLIERALAVLGRRVGKVGGCIDSPAAARTFCQLAIGHRYREVFGVMFLDAQHHLIEFREMFQGTLTQTSVYPREIIRAALALNAGAVVLTHNHPSSNVEPSRADEVLTENIKQAARFVDLRVLDHVIVSETAAFSMADRGLM